MAAGKESRYHMYVLSYCGMIGGDYVFPGLHSSFVFSETNFEALLTPRRVHKTCQTLWEVVYDPPDYLVKLPSVPRTMKYPVAVVVVFVVVFLEHEDVFAQEEDLGRWVCEIKLARCTCG